MPRFRFFVALCILAATACAAPAAAAKKTFVYVHDSGSSFNRVFGFRLANDGTLTPLPNSPFATNNNPTGCGGECHTMDYSAKRKALVVAGEDGISVLKVAKSGQLSLVPGSPFDNDGDFIGAVVVEKGNKTFVYAGDYVNDRIHSFRLNNNGTLTELSPSHTDVGDQPIAMVTSGGRLFVVNEGDDTINSFRVNNDGSLTEALDSPFEPSGPLFTAVPVGNVIYSAVAGPDGVLANRINTQTGALTPVAGSPFASTADTGTGVVASGSLLLTEGFDTHTQVFRINANGTLTSLGMPQATGFTQTNAGTFAPGGILVLAGFGQGVATFRVNGSSGALTPLDTDAAAIEDPTRVIGLRR
jgi:6-phosphogluconolactonase